MVRISANTLFYAIFLSGLLLLCSNCKLYGQSFPKTKIKMLREGFYIIKVKSINFNISAKYPISIRYVNKYPDYVGLFKNESENPFFFIRDTLANFLSRRVMLNNSIPIDIRKVSYYYKIVFRNKIFFWKRIVIYGSQGGIIRINRKCYYYPNLADFFKKFIPVNYLKL